MKPVTIVGLLLIVLGIVGFVVGGVSFTQTKKDAQIGPVEINTSRRRRIRSRPC